MSQQILGLKKFRFFKHLSEDELNELSSKLIPIEIEKDETLFHIGEKGSDAYLVTSGKIEISAFDRSGNKIIYSIVKSGGILGELSLLDQEPRSATAIALEKTILYQFKRKVLIEFLKKYPMAALEFLRFFAERIRRTDDLLRYSTTENPNIIADSKMSLLDRISAKIGQRIITVGFVVANIILFSAWIIFNVISIEFFPHFDPYPFSFLSAISTIEAFFITCLVLISQNILSRKEKIRNDVEYEVNLKTQFEIERLSKKIDKLLAEKKDANK